MVSMSETTEFFDELINKIKKRFPDNERASYTGCPDSDTDYKIRIKDLGTVDTEKADKLLLSEGLEIKKVIHNSENTYRVRVRRN